MDINIHPCPENENKCILRLEKKLRRHIRNNDLDSLRNFIIKHPGIDINSPMHAIVTQSVFIENSGFTEIWGTPLQHAVLCNKIECIKMLMEHGANVNINNYGEMSALTCAIEVFESTPFSKLERQKLYVEIIEFLILAGADCNFQKLPYDTTPLMTLCVCLYKPDKSVTKIIDLLLSHGTDRSIMNSKGQTAEMIARESSVMIADYIRDYEQLPGTKGCYGDEKN